MNPSITKQAFSELCGQAPHRIDLSCALKRDDPNSGYIGKLNFSFADTVKLIFESETDLSLFPNKHKLDGVWRSVKTEAEYRKIEEWIKKQGSTVFIRSLLPRCIALDLRGDGVSETHAGNLEKRAKKGDTAAAEELAGLLADKIQNTAFYQDAKYIAAVPPPPDKSWDLPSVLVEKIGAGGLKNITGGFAYNGEKSTIKDAAMKEKWELLENSGLVFLPEKCDTLDSGMGEKTVILLDDKYQSGATMHYAAMALQCAGFSRIYGLAAIKTMKNDDNR